MTKVDYRFIGLEITTSILSTKKTQFYSKGRMFDWLTVFVLEKQSTKKQSLGKYEANKLFFNVEMIKECSEKFLAKVEEMQKEEVIIVNFLDMVSENAGALFGKAVVKYCKNMNHQNEILKHLLENEIWFAAKTRQLEKDPILNDKTFKSFLVVPLSRICHIPLLLEKIVKVSKHLTDDYSGKILNFKATRKNFKDTI